MAQDLESLRKLLRDALARRWKGRNNYRQIMCGIEDVEIIEEGIASGAEVIATDEDYARFEAKENIAKAKLSKSVHGLMRYFKDIEFDTLEIFLSQCRFKYQCSEHTIQKTEPSKRVKDDLRTLAEKAYSLAIAMLEIGEGAREILSRNRCSVAGTDANGDPLRGSVNVLEWQELKEYGDLFKKQSSDESSELSLKVSASLLEDADVRQLPWVIPYDPDRAENDDGLHEYEWSLGGLWIVRLQALAELAEANAKQLEIATAKGGRKTFGSRIHGSPEDRLAQVCGEFAIAHGCKSQAVVLKMVQAVMEAEHGKHAMTRVDGKPSQDKGRKAVRKLAQTKPKSGTV